MELEYMPGPTPEAKALQLKQCNLRDAFYEARARQPDSVKDNGPEAKQALAAYEASVSELAALLGPDAPCYAVDTDLWSLFSDLHKDEVGVRPRNRYTVAEVKEWIERRSRE